MTRTRITAMGAAVAVLVIAGFGGWYFFIRDDAPPPVSLADAVASVSDSTAEAGDDATPEPTASGTADPSTIVTPADAATTEPTATAAADTSGASSLAGTWVLADGSESFVGYRVAEELSTIGVTTAVGRTSDVAATLTFDGTTITAVEVEANLAALASDDDRRDRALRSQALETNDFPTATFSLTEPITLDVEPTEGVPIAATAVGDLTLHGVTRSVSIALEGQLVGEQVVVVGSTGIAFADFDIDPPTAIILVSVADEGTIELQLVLERG